MKVRIKRAPGTETEVRVVLPSGKYVHVRDDELLPLADALEKFAVFGIEQ